MQNFANSNSFANLKPPYKDPDSLFGGSVLPSLGGNPVVHYPNKAVFCPHHSSGGLIISQVPDKCSDP